MIRIHWSTTIERRLIESQQQAVEWMVSLAGFQQYMTDCQFHLEFTIQANMEQPQA